MKVINPPKDMMTPHDVATATGIGVNQVYLLLKERHIPSISIGRDILVPRPQYQRWLETVVGNFTSVTGARNAARNDTRNGTPKREIRNYRDSYWSSMTPEQRSKEVRRRLRLGKKQGATA